MPFVRSNPDDESARGEVGSGAPPFPGDPDAVDWADPELVKVHYDVTAWDYEQRAELAETLAERNVPHMWASEAGAEELVVPEAAEEFTDAIFAELEAELGPFPVVLGADEEGVDFPLEEWTEADVDTLRVAIVEAEIPHRWRGRTVRVAADAADTVDELVEAIEAGEVASADGEGAPDGALHDLFALADTLARDPGDGPAAERLTELVPQLAVDAPPYGLAVRAWATIVNHAEALAGALAQQADGPTVEASAAELRSVCRPYV